MQHAYMYLAAVIDWYSRHVFLWRLSNTLDSPFCIEAVEDAFITSKHQPEIFNTDQRSQLTSSSVIKVL